MRPAAPHRPSELRYSSLPLFVAQGGRVAVVDIGSKFGSQCAFIWRYSAVL